MTPPDVTLAQIGCGYWGPNLLRNFTELPGSYVKYVVEASDDRRRYVRENFPRTTPTADRRSNAARYAARGR